MSRIFNNNFFKATLPNIIMILILLSYVRAIANGYMPMFIYDGVRYGVIDNTVSIDVKSNIAQDYTYLGSTEHKFPFYFMLRNDFDGYRLPKGTKIYTTDKFFGEYEDRLFIVKDNSVYYCIPNVEFSSFYDKHLKQYFLKWIKFYY